jgi:hypothetical protein
MKKLFSLIAVSGLVCGGLLAGCSKSETVATPDMPSTNAPAAPATNAPATPSTNAP